MNLKEYARSRGTNIKKLAEKIDVTPSTLYAIANGSTDFDHIGISLFNKIADALNVTTDELYKILKDDSDGISDGSLHLTENELRLVFYYRNSNENGKDAILNSAKMQCLSAIYENGGADAVVRFGYDENMYELEDLL